MTRVLESGVPLIRHELWPVAAERNWNALPDDRPAARAGGDAGIAVFVRTKNGPRCRPASSPRRGRRRMGPPVSGPLARAPSPRP
jgi:hypothetical protein